MTGAQDVHRMFLEEVTRRGLPAPVLQDDGRYEMKIEELTVTICLDNLIKDYASDHDAARIPHFVDAIVSTLLSAGRPVPPTWKEAETGVRYAAEPSDYDFGDAIADRISDTLYRLLAYSHPDEARIVWLTPAMIEDWKKSLEEVRDTALRNLASQLAATEFHVEDVEGMKLGWFQSSSAFKAAFLFAPNLREYLNPHLGWPVYAVAPNRDFVYLFAQTDKDLIPRVAGIVVEQYEEGGYPISLEVFAISDDGFVAIGRFAPAPEEKRHKK
jgi:hypothetical protein